MGLLDSLFRKAAQDLGNQVGKSINKAINTRTESFTFSKLPTSPEELKALPEADLKSPFKTAALTVLALAAFETDKEACYQMIQFLMGPETLKPSDRQFINDRFMDGKTYIPRSYMKGATPANNYAPAMPVQITVIEGAHSRDCEKEGYMTLYIASGGADNPREVRLRTKPSTGEWFVNQYGGLLSGIRIPVEQDKWA